MVIALLHGIVERRVRQRERDVLVPQPLIQLAHLHSWLILAWNLHSAEYSSSCEVSSSSEVSPVSLPAYV